MKTVVQEFMTGFRESPRMYFAPVIGAVKAVVDVARPSASTAVTDITYEQRHVRAENVVKRKKRFKLKHLSIR